MAVVDGLAVRYRFAVGAGLAVGAGNRAGNLRCGNRRVLPKKRAVQNRKDGTHGKKNKEGDDGPQNPLGRLFSFFGIAGIHDDIAHSPGKPQQNSGPRKEQNDQLGHGVDEIGEAFVRHEATLIVTFPVVGW